MSVSAQGIGFASAAALLSAIRAKAPERRRFRRMPIVVGGRMLDARGREHDCRTADISPGDVRLALPNRPEVGQRVVIYLDQIGRVSGAIARHCGESEVAVIFDNSTHKREKLAETLTYMANKAALGLEDAAKAAPPAGSSLARIEIETGEIIEGEVLDLSLAGMTVRSLRLPPIGAWVRFGGVYGRIARRIEGGFAVDFETRGAAPPAGQP